MPIKTLQIVERWDCGQCGRCCRGSRIDLDEADVRRLREQQWGQHADFRGVRIIVRSWLTGRSRLAQRRDGTCVFFSDAGRCRIHEQFGYDAKPLVCRMFPLQLVPLETTVQLTLRRSCPAAAGDRGRELAEHRRAVQDLVNHRPSLVDRFSPPAVTRGRRASWEDALIVARTLERLLTDSRYPLVRRLVHGLRFCELLEQCRLRRMKSEQLREAASVLADSAPGQVGDVFANRRVPDKAAGVLFRQTVAEYLRVHPAYHVESAWRERWRLTRAAFGFPLGKGLIPPLHRDFPARSFESLEQRALGPLNVALQQPLNAYYETHAASLQYAILSRPHWSLIEKYRALALTYPVALWMLRYVIGDQAPTEPDIIDMITAVERGQGYGPLVGITHRRRIRNLADLKALEPLVAWYAR